MVKRKKRRSSGPLIAWISIGVVVALVATFVLIKELQGSTTQQTSFGFASQQLYDDVTQIPASVYNQVGITTSEIQVTAPQVLTDAQPSYKVNGLPGVFYYGAEYCPYCAATRWGIIAALARFGGWKDDQLALMKSSSTDYAPNTPTFSFYQTTYTSKYFHFKGYEVYNRDYKPLMTAPAAINRWVERYDTSGSYPFMDMNNKVFITSSAFDPIALSGITSQEAIASQLTNTSNPVTQAIVATANYVTAGLCSVAKDPPSSVCHSPGVQAAATALKLKL